MFRKFISIVVAVLFLISTVVPTQLLAAKEPSRAHFENLYFSQFFSVDPDEALILSVILQSYADERLQDQHRPVDAA